MAQFAIGVTKVASIRFLREDGTPGRVDGIPVWTNSNEAAVNMSVAADGMSATVVMLAEGTAQLVADGDADLGAGVRSVRAIGDVEVLGAEVVTAVMDFTDPA